ncbi:MAG: InlB B-repeat-containing protein [Oscillospiraceae bacterium]|nr:InlB B-repeat-containing protein [Oscillospiraceae bacterium]
MYTITYVLNGGVYAGSRANIRETYPAGTVISIHEAPIRRGYRFLYWQGSAYYPGESYTVTGDHTFTAQWERTYEPDISPRTGDNSRLGLWTLLMLLSLSCLAFVPAVYRKKGTH